MSVKKFFSNNRLALIDGNSFYWSCETVTRPHLRNKPGGVLSNNDGCFVSASAVLKKYGIRTGTPYFEMKKLCREIGAHVFSANFENYSFLSKLMFKAIKSNVPDAEIYSVDEGFADVSIIPKNELLEFGFHLKNEVYKHSRIPVGIGIAPTKSLAKIANKLAKSTPHFKHVYEINELNLDWSLDQIDVENLWGIGRSGTDKLKKLGIRNARHLKDYPHPDLIQKLLTINGRKIQLELQGVQCFRMHEQLEKKREISHSRTLLTRTNDIRILRESLATYATLAADEMRRQGSVCKEVKLWMRTDVFKPELPQYSNEFKFQLQGYTFDTFKIIQAVWHLLNQMYHPVFEYRKIGVTLSNLQDFDQFQKSLFGADDSEERIRLMNAMDIANQRYGECTVKSAACGTGNERWEAEVRFKSPSYYTNWVEIPKIIKTIE